MKYYANFKINARYIAEIEADSLEEAKEEAEYLFSGVDFGHASDIDGEIISIEDSDGNFVYEK